MAYDYEEFYKKYPVDIHDDGARHSAVAALARGRVLDIGCGAGMLSDYYFGEYVGCDISSVAIKNANEIRREGAIFFVADPTVEKFCVDGRFETVVMSEYLEHIGHDEKVFEAISDVIQPDGRIIITVPNGDRIPCDEHVRTFTIPELRENLSPLGKVTFYDWPGARRQILCTVDLGQKNSDDLSLVMVVKDEEKGLERAILSCIEQVNNIVIAVDDSTTDGTRVIAERYADTVKSFKWSDDFSAARNFAHEGVTSEWILFLDGHEYFEKKENLDRYLEASQDGLSVSVELENGFTFQNPRIYRNGVQFEGKVHEKQNCKSVLLCPQLLIKHDRLGGSSSATALARDAQRDDMVPRIMNEELKKNPKNIRALFHLGLYYQSKGRLKDALSCYNRYLKYSKNKQERWFVMFHKALCLSARGANFQAFWTASLAENELPNRWETAKLKGVILAYKQKHSQAIDYLVKTFELSGGSALYRPWPRNDSDTWNLIGECFFRLGDFDKASTSFERAAELCDNKDAKSFIKKRAELMAEIFKTQFSKKVAKQKK
jgi:glycosyltransferase involved in cell wall biosynthesis